MQPVTPVFVFNSLNVQRGGLTKAVIARANMLVNHYNEVHFCTMDYQQNHLGIIRELKEKGILDERVNVHYFFHDIDPYKTELPQRKSVSEQKGEEVDEEGYLVQIQKTDELTDNALSTSYFSRNGQCFLTVWPDSGNEERGRCVFFNPEPKKYKDIYELYISWLNQKAGTFENPVFMSDSWFTDEMVAKIESIPVKRITVIHNNHYDPPYTKGSELDPDWNYLYAHMDEFDRMVFLTHEQKEDISEQFGHSDRYRVISHAAEPILAKKEMESRNPKLVVSVARYAPQKRIDEAIKAFSLVVQEVPDAEYHVYGYGAEKAKLETLVKKLRLEKNVFLNSFSSDAIAIFESAICSVLTSDYEGFGLVLTESLSAGTPVVAYDVKYGPKDIIRNNIDGYLVKKGNQAALAEKVITILKDPVLAEELSRHAKEVTERFSFENYEKQWLNLFENISKK